MEKRRTFKRILFVEDDPKDLELALTAFGEINLANKVDVAHDGEEALDYLFKRGKYKKRKSGNPVVILLDIKLPKIDGLEVLKQIKESTELHDVPVVMLTSSKIENDLVTSYKLRANAFIIKPVIFENFMATIKDVGTFWAIINETP